MVTKTILLFIWPARICTGFGIAARPINQCDPVHKSACGARRHRSGVDHETHSLLWPKRAVTAQRYCARPSGGKHFARVQCVFAGGRDMRKQDAGFDYHRYRQLLVDAVDEDKRLALIALLIEERAKDRLAAEHDCERALMPATTIAKVLGTPALGMPALGASRR